MRPIRLEMEGFSTFRDRVDIDFTGIDVMALVGPTGAGKSTIIDAITFALYGSVARYDDRGAVAPVINQLSPEAKVRLDFDAGGHRYTAVRVVRRTKTGATTKEARLECNGEVLAGDPRGLDAAVKALLGLDFERFNKTVVLPQGKFATFLHDKPADRQQLLRELLGMGVYERAGRLSRQRASVAESQLAILEPRLAGAADLTDERLANLTKTRERAIAAREQLRLATVRVEQLQIDSTELRTRANQLHEQLAALAHVVVPDGLDSLADQLRGAADAAAAAEAELGRARLERRACEQAVKNGPSLSRSETLIQQHEELAAAHDRVGALTTEVAEATDVSATATAAAETAAAALEAGRRAVDTARAQRDALAAELAALPAAAALEVALANHQRGDELERAFAAASTAASAADTQLADARTQAEQAHMLHQRAVEQAPAAALATTLAPGEPCPVCLQPVMTLPLGGHDNDDVVRAEADATAARASFDAALQHQASAAATLSATTDELERVRQLLVDVGRPAELRQQLTLVAELHTQVETAQRRLVMVERELRATEQAGDGTRLLADATTAQHHLRSVEASLAVYIEQRDRLRNIVAAAPDLATLTAELTRAHQLADDAELAGRSEDAAQSAVAAAQAAVQSIRTKEADARADYQEVRDRVASMSPPRAGSTLLADWHDLHRWARRCETEALAEQRTAVEQAATVAAEIASTIGAAMTACGEFVEQPASTMSRLGEQMAAAAERLDADIQRFTERRAEFDQLLEQIQQVRDTREVATMLGNLLRSDGFEKWLLQEVLTDLVARATVRLKELSGGQFSLVATDGSFQICDHRNADEVRDARTLSGGETFLASLALALALADASADLATAGSAPLESIFLDEGFGTLDPDTLDVVATTLEDLGATGRMVGVVTHIRELAERMPVRLEVTKGPTSSTVVRVEV